MHDSEISHWQSNEGALSKACMVESLYSPRPKVGRAPTDHAYLDDPANSNQYLRSSISQLNKLRYSLDVPFTTNLHSHLETDHHHKDDGQLVKAQTLSQTTKGPTSDCISAVLGHVRPNPRVQRPLTLNPNIIRTDESFHCGGVKRC